MLVLLCLKTAAISQTLDIALASKKGFSSAVSIDKFYGKKFKIGIGLRATTYNSGSHNFVTAPALLTSGKRSLMAFFTPYKNEKLDTLSVPNTSIISINTKLSLEYNLKRSGFGFNIDLAGLTMGKKNTGRFTASESRELNNTNHTVKATPYNLLLISDSDRGSLNSELYFKQSLKKMLICV